MTTLEQSLSQIPNFSPVHEHLLSSGQPTAEQLHHIKEYGCSTVINLALMMPIHTLIRKTESVWN
jgi:hypothetical protein